jgi:hypothetical protein
MSSWGYQRSLTFGCHFRKVLDKDFLDFALIDDFGLVWMNTSDPASGE